MREEAGNEIREKRKESMRKKRERKREIPLKGGATILHAEREREQSSSSTGQTHL